MKVENKIMRDVFIEALRRRMSTNERIFFLSADFGSPKLDRLREEFRDRFINVGIAEQNLINIATGLALEGFTVYAYAIAPFLIMRPYEQIRNNLSLMSQIKEINVNLIGVGAGLSYDVSGPTHHCLEDISLIRTLPNILMFSPSDWVLADKLVDYSIMVKRPKYFRFDGKPLPNIYKPTKSLKLEKGFFILREGEDLCFVTTGYMTHTALKAADILKKEGINTGVLDVFSLKNIDEKHLSNALKQYRSIITIEEAFIGKNGLDNLVSHISYNKGFHQRFINMGFNDSYLFEIGSRESLHRLNGLDAETVAKRVKTLINKQK